MVPGKYNAVNPSIQKQKEGVPDSCTLYMILESEIKQAIFIFNLWRVGWVIMLWAKIATLVTLCNSIKASASSAIFNSNTALSSGISSSAYNLLNRFTFLFLYAIKG